MTTNERLVFKPIDEEDIEWLRETRNKYKDNFFDSHEITVEQHRSWYTRYRDIGTDKMFIVKLKSGEPIGTIALYNIDVSTRTATLGRILLLDEYRKHGYAEEMVTRMLDLAFNSMRLYKVRVETHYENIDAVAIYARAGFKPVTKPILLLEKINPNYDAKKPLAISSYDGMSESYESQTQNIKE